MLKAHAVSVTLPVYVDLRYWGVLVLSGCLFNSELGTARATDTAAAGAGMDVTTTDGTGGKKKKRKDKKRKKGGSARAGPNERRRRP